MLRGIDAVQQLARFRWIEHRRLPTGDDVTRPPNTVRRVEGHHLAVDQPVEQMAQRREPLLDRGRCKLTRPCLDPRRHMHGLNVDDRRHAGRSAPAQKFFRSSSIGSPCVRVADIGREELEETHRRALAGGGDERRQRGRADRDLLPSRARILYHSIR